MLSLCAIASFAESGENAIPRTTKFLRPSGDAGFVENLSRRSPSSSKSCTTRSVVTAAMRFEFGDLGKATSEGGEGDGQRRERGESERRPRREKRRVETEIRRATESQRSHDGAVRDPAPEPT